MASNRTTKALIAMALTLIISGIAVAASTPTAAACSAGTWCAGGKANLAILSASSETGYGTTGYLRRADLLPHHLTAPQGLGYRAVTPIWAGTQEASTATDANVSYLTAAEPSTLGNTLPYATTLAQRHCNTILGVGTEPVDALVHAAASYPGIQFIVIGGPPSTGNVTTVAAAPAAALHTTIATLLTNLSR